MQNPEKEAERMARGARLKEVREDLRVKQKPFALQLGITQPYLSAIELGKKELTTKLTDKLFELFKVSPIWLLKGEGSIYRTENVSLIVPEMSPQSKNAVEEEALRAQRLKALWEQLVNRGKLDFTGIHNAQFSSVLGAYSDKVLSYVGTKVVGQIDNVLEDVLDGKLPITEAPEKLLAYNTPMLELQDLFLGVETAILDMMEGVFRRFPEAGDLVPDYINKTLPAPLVTPVFPAKNASK